MAIASKEEVIKILELCPMGAAKEKYNFSCDICPYAPYSYGGEKYNEDSNCDSELMKDAAEYLKAQ